MKKKTINTIAVISLVLFSAYFVWVLATPQSSSSSAQSCLCLPLFGFAFFGFIWLIVQALNNRKKNIPGQPPQSISIKTTIPISVHPKPVQPANRFVEVQPGTPVPTPRVTLTYSFETGASRFIKDAQKYHGIEGNPAARVAFMQYWPTFESFNVQQKKWYFYWRSQVRQGHYPDTDLSYVFVYVYELLCLIEIPDRSRAAAQLKALWRAYRSRYPTLDRYLPDWGGDLVAATLGTDQGIGWWWDLMMKDGFTPPAPVVNSIIQKSIDAGKMDELPYAIWAGLNLYKPQNKFYQRFNQARAIDQGYLKAIQAINAYYLTLKTPKGLLERYAPPRLYPQTKRAFASAVVPDGYPKEIHFGEARNFVSSSRLGNLLAAITKYTENILRKQAHFSARLSGFELDEKLQTVLDEVFSKPVEKKPEEPVRISLNLDRVEALKAESEQVTDLLKPETQEEAKPLYSDIVQVRALWEKLDLPARRLLMATYEHQAENVDQITADLTGDSISPFSLIDRINNQALPLLGDRILSVENRKRIIIAEDFTDEMELIAKEHTYESLMAINTEEQPTGAEDHWQSFLNQLSPDETTLLGQFVATSSLSEDEIESFARQRGQMGNLLIDSLNEKAIEHLGRTPFYAEDGHWFVEEEDLAVLREIVKVEGA